MSIPGCYFDSYRTLRVLQSWNQKQVSRHFPVVPTSPFSAIKYFHLLVFPLVTCFPARRRVGSRCNMVQSSGVPGKVPRIQNPNLDPRLVWVLLWSLEGEQGTFKQGPETSKPRCLRGSRSVGNSPPRFLACACGSCARWLLAACQVETGYLFFPFNTCLFLWASLCTRHEQEQKRASPRNHQIGQTTGIAKEVSTPNWGVFLVSAALFRVFPVGHPRETAPRAKQICCTR